jgi:antitoxin component YwqK of YwqJK toxin-antitoxin module
MVVRLISWQTCNWLARMPKLIFHLPDNFQSIVMGCSFGYFPESENELKYTCTNQTYQDFNFRSREFSEKKGTLVCRATIKDGNIEEYKDWIDEGDILRPWNHRFYKNGILKESKYFYPNGACWKQEIYHDETLMECKWWYHDGFQIWKQIFRKYEYRDGVKIGKLHGSYKIWHSNGQLALEETFKDGKINGERTKYTIHGDPL